jgi:flagellar biosynthetic protein FliR
MSDFPVDALFVYTVFLVSVRLAAVLIMTPILYAFSVPATVRIALVVALAVMLVLAFPAVQIDVAPDLGSLFLAMLNELVLGAILGLGILMAFAACSVAGNLLDVQIGYGMAQIFDPLSRRQLPILTSVFNQLAIIVFFILNGHHALLRGLAYSMEHFPPARGWHYEGAVGPLLKQAASLFSLGFSLVAPVVFCIFLAEIGLSALARNLPQMNMFAFGVPVKIVVGLSALSLWMLGAGDVMSRVVFSIFQTWQRIFVEMH